MALPVRYRLLGQLAFSFKINELLTEPITDLWAPFFDSDDTRPKVKTYKSNSAVEKIRQQITQLRASVVRPATQPRLPASSTPHDPNPQNEVEVLADLYPTSHGHTSKVSQLSEEIEYEIERLLLDVYESLWKARVDIASLKRDKRVLRTELCSIKGTDGIGGISILSLMQENRSLRMRIIELESCNKTLLLRENPFDDPESGWKCNPKVR
jgi:hypothetical protein